ncbi:related to Mig1 protein [Sporisorium reilianum f. sp. reilianum]|uniref:Related to Mig1 protein n=1 Tax=Sporisorium reilianum f. sp. reilianum TaxID=72559 RepID=A0A2N8UFD5_9BASI|nr:related to Mig1 protein [Sporisorium reilianum f. sp. reilianum]
MSIQKPSVLAVAWILVAALVQFVLVAADEQAICSTQPPILPDFDHYRRFCSNGNIDGRAGPCFSHESGSLYGADVSTTVKHNSEDKEPIILVRNADLVGTAFTPYDDFKDFVIDYHQAGIRFHYTGGIYNPKVESCHILRLEKYDPDSDYRMYIRYNDGGPEAIGVDTDDDNKLSSSTCLADFYIYLDKKKK